MLSFSEQLAFLRQPPAARALRSRLRGLEKESLRVEVGSGLLAQTPHPAALGSALTNPHITTDFAEALLEFITEPCASISEALAQLDAIHRFTYSQLDNELLWVASMPCVLPDDAAIPVAAYGCSNVARMKTAYRVGLGNRYGRAMQTIAGLHFNFSLGDEFFTLLQQARGDRRPLTDFKTDAYFALIRNFHRHAWLLIYLFGASPAVCKSFLQGREHQLTPLGRNTLHGEYATALRMGDLGYTSSAQESLFVCYNQLDSYISSLHKALTAPYPAFQKLGIRDAEGGYKQLSDAVLQIENEYYSPVRPKRTTLSGETPITALRERGVEYIEVRCLDLNPFLPLGTDEPGLQFVELFLLNCLFQADDSLNAFAYKEAKANLRRVINEGRKPGLQLQRNGQPIALTAWASELLDSTQAVAEVLEANGETGLSAAITAQRLKVNDTQQTPSARILQALNTTESFFDFVMQQSLATEIFFKAEPLAAAKLAAFQQAAVQSWQAQAAIEAADTESFEAYLARYYQQYQGVA